MTDLVPGALIQPGTSGGTQSVLPSSFQLPRNPQLVDAPGASDASYEAQHALLRHEIQNRYNDVLRQLGYMDPAGGGFIPVSVESEAQRQRAELNRSLGLAREGVTNEMQQAGTLFSGYRGTAQARAEHPFVSSLADLDITVPQKLSDLYLQGSGLTEEYHARQMALLADAAQRAAAAGGFGAYGGYGGGTGGGTGVANDGGGDGVAPPPPPPPPDPYNLPIADPGAQIGVNVPPTGTGLEAKSAQPKGLASKVWGSDWTG